MFKLDGKNLPLDVPFTHNGIQYPANWLRLSTKEEKDALGIVEVEVQSRPDDRFYWVSDNNDGTFTSIPKDLNDLKSTLITQVKSAAQSILSQTDWMVVRAAESNTSLDSTIKTYRESVRAKSNDIETAINACKKVDTLQALNISDWPVLSTANTVPTSNT